MQTDCFPETPAEWTKGPISALAKVNPRYKVRNGVEHPFVEMAAVGEDFGGILSFARRCLEGSGLTRFRVGDTLFAKITPCPQNGKIAFVESLPGDVGLGSTEFLVLSPTGETHPRFLYHLLCSHDVRGRAAARMEGSTGRQRIPEEVFEKRLLVPLPLPDEQAAIARVLDAVDNAIEKTRAAVERAKDLEHSVLHALLDNTQRRWPLRRVDEVADVGSGVTLGKDVSGAKSVELPYLRVANVQDGHLDLREVKTVRVKADEAQRYMLAAGDVLMTEGGDIDKLGRGTIWRGEVPNCLHQNHVFRIRSKGELAPEYYALVVESDLAKAYFARVAKRTTNLASTNKTQVRAFRFPVPPTLEEQQRIAQTVGAAKRTVAALRAKQEALNSLKRALSHDLLTGKVRLHTNPLEEVLQQ